MLNTGGLNAPAIHKNSTHSRVFMSNHPLPVINKTQYAHFFIVFIEQLHPLSSGHQPDTHVQAGMQRRTRLDEV